MIRMNRLRDKAGTTAAQGDIPDSTSDGQGVSAALVVDALTAVPTWAVAPLVRPWHMRWGASTREVLAEMPGDAVVPGAQFVATRAITIQAPPMDVWPWIAQLGYGRAGFYSYDLIDNGGRRSARQIIDEYQHIEVGDLIPMFHDFRGLSIAYDVDSLDPPRWMLWVHRPHQHDRPDSTWSWRLTALPGEGTRLITRMKQDYRWWTPRLAAFNLVLMEFGDFAMERRMLRGIKARAEAAVRARPRGEASSPEAGAG